ncbi:hypothetical protein M3Y96_01112100 [Aphelenchoides besseyi]|nr:hypothetical protein M3Y96_01112100 [Aphelenchoides besseyi]
MSDSVVPKLHREIRMKLDQVLNRLQGGSDELNETVKSEPLRQTPEDSSSVADELIGQKPEQISMDVTTQGIMAVGGCRKCSRTFTTRLSLIHHFVDHFPSIFYSFENAASTTGSPSQSTFLTQLADIFVTKQSEFPRFPIGNSRPVDETKTTDAKGTIKVKKRQAITSLSRPQIEIHSISTTTNDSFETNDNDSLQYHMCSQCCLTFSETQAFENHVLTHIAQKSQPSSTSCEQCGMQFCNTYLLTEHKQLHTKTCEICAAKFTTLFDFNLHIGEHLDYVYSCKDCGRCFPTRKTLAEHNQIHRTISLDLSTEKSTSKNEKVPSERPQKANKRSISEITQTVDRPPSLLHSNPYFNSTVVQEKTRRRRSRTSKTSRTNWSRLKLPCLFNVQNSIESKSQLGNVMSISNKMIEEMLSSIPSTSPIATQK